MKQAFYHRTDGLPPRELEVLRKNADGTVDLGEGEREVVTGCPVTDHPVAGSCTLFAAPPAKAKDEPEDSDKEEGKDAAGDKDKEKPKDEKAKGGK
jgi:hypothetical protein